MEHCPYKCSTYLSGILLCINSGIVKSDSAMFPVLKEKQETVIVTEVIKQSVFITHFY